MKFSRFALLIAGIIALQGCIAPSVDLVVPQAPSKLVVASQVVLLPGIDTSLVVNVTRSFSSLATGDNDTSLSSSLLATVLVDSAFVTIEHSGTIDTLTWVGDTTGMYTTSRTPIIENETYTLRVKDKKTGESISASTTLLPRVMLQDVAPKVSITTRKAPIGTSYDTLVEAKIAIAFDDIPNTENYYMLNVYNTSRKSGSTTTISNPLTASQSSGNTLLLTDKLFATARHTDTIRYELDKQRFLTNPNASDTLVVTLSNISRTYYDFLQKRAKAGSSIISQLLGEPINYPTNVTNGYGFFNLHSPSAWVVIAKK